MSKEEEKVLNVPIKPEVRKLLDARADDNGRAASREAASIIESADKPQDPRQAEDCLMVCRAAR